VHQIGREEHVPITVGTVQVIGAHSGESGRLFRRKAAA